ncbi:MAG: sigma-70 family RNA polymerase sigma factor [Lachnospiraceae bacterium]|nr:sigma-70 family RNA polymerase sigma factor [Lachnospiraceae bacterium]
MEEREYHLHIGGRTIKVSKEVYQEYYRGERKERYFMKDLKAEHISIDSETYEWQTIPSREDSYERLLEMNKQFEAFGQDVEEQALQAMMLGQAIQALTAQEREIIEELYVLENTERQVSEALHIAKTTLRRRHKEVLDKLRELFEERS